MQKHVCCHATHLTERASRVRAYVLDAPCSVQPVSCVLEAVDLMSAVQSFGVFFAPFFSNLVLPYIGLRVPSDLLGMVALLETCIH